MPVNIEYDVDPDVKKVLKQSLGQVARAVTQAVRDGGNVAKSKSRAALASAGFSSRAQNAVRMNAYPQHGNSLSAAAVVTLNAKWATVFEEGATISGKPYLWIPLPNVPLGSNGRRLSVKEYADRLGQLVSINVPGKAPMLAGRVTTASVTKATANLARLRKRALQSGDLQGKLVPLFVGVPAVTDPKKYDLDAIAEQVNETLPGKFEELMANNG